VLAQQLLAAAFSIRQIALALGAGGKLLRAQGFGRSAILPGAR
jgi:hypothetical protein